ncbi:hypothetical protein KDX27_31470 [Burkholderia cenocepacia]|uniref:hypothetical protein n=1 Tax=Burkholderia cenocepacia TaxID=95486 RepID=UPI001B8E4EED|nr:hypothetical protein [Burkholderia cenocepacia]MBR8028561.1 hypothetical protein [Burkholderia cenocepacia]MBR8172259.1 hypothetical protein [Burkholderia cenocepacia]
MLLTTTDERARFLAFAQQHWIADQHAAHDTHSYTALFAGHPAHLQFETDGAWRLYYLGFRSERIFHVANARRAAPAFVRDVLAHMMALVVDGEPGISDGPAV